MCCAMTSVINNIQHLEQVPIGGLESRIERVHGLYAWSDVRRWLFSFRLDWLWMLLLVSFWFKLVVPMAISSCLPRCSRCFTPDRLTLGTQITPLASSAKLPRWGIWSTSKAPSNQRWRRFALQEGILSDAKAIRIRVRTQTHILLACHIVSNVVRL